MFWALLWDLNANERQYVNEATAGPKNSSSKLTATRPSFIVYASMSNAKKSARVRLAGTRYLPTHTASCAETSEPRARAGRATLSGWADWLGWDHQWGVSALRRHTPLGLGA